MEEEQNMIEMMYSSSFESNNDDHFYDLPHIETEDLLISNEIDDFENYNSLCKYCIEKDNCKTEKETYNNSETLETNPNYEKRIVNQAGSCDSKNHNCAQCILLKKLPDFNVDASEEMDCCDAGSLIV